MNAPACRVGVHTLGQRRNKILPRASRTAHRFAPKHIIDGTVNFGCSDATTTTDVVAFAAFALRRTFGAHESAIDVVPFV